MATTNTAPEAIAQPFANNGDKTFPIPSADVGTNAASLDKGIPSVCSEPLDTTGLPVRRSDFNALGYLATSGLFFAQNGGFYTFNSAVSSAIGGYPTGAKLWATVDGESVLVRSLKDNNTDNFVTTPSYIGNGTSWAADLPYNNQLPEYLHVRDEKTSGTNGDTSVLSESLITLNTVKVNRIAGASLLNNKITLPTGQYRVSAHKIFTNTDSNNRTRIVITDETDELSSDLVIGVCSSGSTNDDTVDLFVRGEFTITESRDVAVTLVSNDAGQATYAVDDERKEVYAEVEIWKLA